MEKILKTKNLKTHKKINNPPLKGKDILNIKHI